MEKAELVREIIELQRKVDRARRQRELGLWMGLPLTIAQLKSLFFISNQGSTNLGNLAAALGVTPTNTTGIVDRLVKKKLVSRNEDAQDRRMLLLQATTKGEELVTNLRDRRRGHMSEVLALMSMGELVTLAQGLTSLVKANEAYKGKNKDCAAR
jgi:DNA-binding MarR family transcriptional regulator